MNVKPYFSRSSANGYAFRFVRLALPRGRGVRIVADRPLSAAEAKAGAFAGARARVDGSVRSRVWVGLGPGAGGGPPNTAPYAGPHFAAALGAAIEIEVVVALPVNEPAGRCASRSRWAEDRSRGQRDAAARFDGRGRRSRSARSTSLRVMTPRSSPSSTTRNRRYLVSRRNIPAT